MKTNPENDRLLFRALEKGVAGEPSSDFTLRVMERVTQVSARRERRENRLLLAGAVMCALGLVLLVACVFRVLPERGMFESLGDSFSRLSTSLGRMNADACMAIPHDSGDGFVLSLWCYTAVLFLAFAIVRQLLLRKRTGTSVK